MTGREVILLQKTLLELGTTKNTRLALAIVKNLRRIEPIIEEIMATDTSDVLNNFEQERLSLCNLFSKKDADGNPVIDNGRFVVEDQDVFNNSFEALKLKYKDDIDSFKAKQEAQVEMLKKEFNVELIKIKESDLPKDLDATKVEGLSSLLQ
jgi:hypothetical protein